MAAAIAELEKEEGDDETLSETEFRRPKGPAPKTKIGKDAALAYASESIFPQQAEAKPKPTTGRGNKGRVQKVADAVKVDQSPVRKRAAKAAEIIGEPVDLERDTPEELKRKADEVERKAPTWKADRKQGALANLIIVRALMEETGITEDQLGELAYYHGGDDYASYKFMTFMRGDLYRGYSRIKKGIEGAIDAIGEHGIESALKQARDAQAKMQAKREKEYRRDASRRLIVAVKSAMESDLSQNDILRAVYLGITGKDLPGNFQLAVYDADGTSRLIGGTLGFLQDLDPVAALAPAVDQGDEDEVEVVIGERVD